MRLLTSNSREATLTSFVDSVLFVHLPQSLCRAVVAFFLFVLPVCAQGDAAEPTQREIYTCEDERKRFSLWSWFAGDLPEASLLERVSGSEIVTFTTTDNRALRGLRLRAGAKSRDALLIIQGNMWSTKAFADIAWLFPKETFDVFFFDFRGYGLSTPANPTISAIVNDYRDIGLWLKKQGYRHLYLYAYSFGGVVALSSFSDSRVFRRIVLDSVPARPSQMGFKCKQSYDPIDKLPRSCPHLVFMHGTSDWVVSRRDTQPLIDAVRECKGQLDIEESRGHPFQIEWASSKIRRIEAMVHHLQQRGE
jgi:pimeloyl-ACP methyl ester carboxylesterase